MALTGTTSLGYKTAATILILIILAALLFRLAVTPYAVFLSVNNGIEEAPLWSLVIVEKDQPVPGDTVVACKDMRCSIMLLAGVEEDRDGRLVALVKSSEASAPYPVPFEDVKYRLAATVPPSVWAPVLVVALVGVVYVKRLLRTLSTTEGVWLLILAWLLSTLSLAAFAAPSTPLNTPEIPTVDVGRIRVLDDYTIAVPFNGGGAAPGTIESCVALVPRLPYPIVPDAVVEGSTIMVRIRPVDWYVIADTLGRIADFRLECRISLAGVNGTLFMRFPVHVEFRELMVERTRMGALIVNPNPFPLNVSYTITYYTGEGRSLVAAERVQGGFTIEPLGDVWIGLGNYTRAVGALKIEYPWGVKYEPISIP